LLWRSTRISTCSRREDIEWQMLRTVGWALFSIFNLHSVRFGSFVDRERSSGAECAIIAISAFSLYVMSLLARAQRRMANGIRFSHSRWFEADSFQCVTSTILAGGSVLNATFCWWWGRSARRVGNGSGNHQGRRQGIQGEG
jgi:hypothetical protein